MPRLSDAQGHEALINPDGSLKTQVVGSLANAVGAPLSAVPTNAIEIGGTDGTNLQALKTYKAAATSVGGGSGDAVLATAMYGMSSNSSPNVRPATITSPLGDGQYISQLTFLMTSSASLLYNGTSLDMARGNTEGTLLASAAQTASVNSADITIYNGSKLAVYLDVAAASGTTPTLDVTVKAKDPASGKYFLLGTFTQKTGVVSDVLFIGNGAGSTFAARTIRVEAVIGGTSPSFTFSVGYSATVS